MLILIYFKASNIDFVHNFYAIHLYWIRVQHSANPVNFWLDLIKGKAKLLQGLLFNEVIYLFHSHSLLAAAFWCINCINECRLYTSILVQLLWCNVLYLFILQRATFFLPNNEMFQKKMVQGFSSFYILSLEVNILLEQYEIIHRFQGETANINLNAQNCFGLIESESYERK